MKAELSKDGKIIIVTIPMNFRKRGGRKLIIAPDGMEMAPPAPYSALAKLVAKAHRWLKMLENGEAPSIRAVAAQEKTDESYVGKVLRLTLLAPDIVELILDNKQPDVMTWNELKKPFPVEWPKQREKWGIPEPKQLS